ncbi:MAG: hypothetical protein AAF549_03310 [Pseudomonadota bacterium]
MKKVFLASTSNFSPDEITLSSENLFPAIDLNGFFEDLTCELRAFQAKRQIEIGSTYLFGGAIADLLLGNRPKDYDVFVRSPDWINVIKRFRTARDNVSGFKEAMELNEVEEHTLYGYLNPVSKIDDMVPFTDNDLIGLNTAYLGAYSRGNSPVQVDLRIGSHAPGIVKFLQNVSSPVMAAGIEITETGDVLYAHHVQFFGDLEKGIMRVRKETPELAEKADRKGLRLETIS